MDPWHVVYGMLYMECCELHVVCRISNVPVACCIWNVLSCMSCVESVNGPRITGVFLLLRFSIATVGLVRLGLASLVLGSSRAVVAAAVSR